MNTDKLVYEWLQISEAAWNALNDVEKGICRSRYAEQHVVIRTEDPKPPTLHERLLDVLSGALECGFTSNRMEASEYIRKAMNIIRTADRIELHATRDGKMRVVESGRDCDGVEYDGRCHTIEATLAALEELHDSIGEWADGPFRLDIVSWDTDVEYTSRDLVLEAYENGHRHSIVSRFP